MSYRYWFFVRYQTRREKLLIKKRRTYVDNYKTCLFFFKRNSIVFFMYIRVIILLLVFLYTTSVSSQFVYGVKRPYECKLNNTIQALRWFRCAAALSVSHTHTCTSVYVRHRYLTIKQWTYDWKLFITVLFIFSLAVLKQNSLSHHGARCWRPRRWIWCIKIHCVIDDGVNDQPTPIQYTLLTISSKLPNNLI